MLLHAADHAQALIVAERLRRKLHQTPAIWQSKQIKMTVSIGMTLEAAVDRQVLFARADALVYRAKKEGRDRVCY